MTIVYLKVYLWESWFSGWILMQGAVAQSAQHLANPPIHIEARHWNPKPHPILSYIFFPYWMPGRLSSILSIFKFAVCGIPPAQSHEDLKY